ncbi:MAG: hypothetical protein JWN98_708 [Abditibacteriota bacterium]|nr:hypothetical protein [Abditibacteriota bacterium]
MRWTRKGIVAEIQQLHRDGAALNYAAAEAHYLQLMRAAAWHFGTWRHAVETAGIDYSALSKYRRWGRDRIIERIRELHHEGADLSWRSISLEIDPALAAAALRPNGFASWRQAIAAAGLDIEEVARYQAWDAERVIQEIHALHREKKPMSSKLVQINNQSLFCAARRRFGSWDEALSAAGLDVSQIRLRQPAQRIARSTRKSTVQSSRKTSRSPRQHKASGESFAAGDAAIRATNPAHTSSNTTVVQRSQPPLSKSRRSNKSTTAQLATTKTIAINRATSQRTTGTRNKSVVPPASRSSRTAPPKALRATTATHKA